MSAIPPPLVLIVDDYQDARELYAEYLRASGFRVVEAANGVEAVTKAGELAPDLILMDLSLPDIDGVEATRRLKADARTRGIPIVVLTGQTARSALDRAREAGCSAFVIKPALPEQVLHEIRKTLEA